MTNGEDYDLDVLLELREKEKGEAEERYARAMRRVEECEEEVRRNQQVLNDLVAKRREECRRFDARVCEETPQIVEIRNFDHYVQGLLDREREAKQEVDAARKALRRAKKQVEQANQEMLEAVRQLKAVEKHYEKWQREQAIEQKRRRAAKMDDVAARIWRERHG